MKLPYIFIEIINNGVNILSGQAASNNKFASTI